MKGYLLIILLLFSTSGFCKTINVVTFNYPPLMGKNDISDSGVLVEIVAAAFKESGIDINVSYVPVKRAINSLEEGKALFMIGLLDYFSQDAQKSLTTFPLLLIDFDIFYLKSRFPNTFKYKDIQELKSYSIGVLLNGSTDLYGRKMGLRVDGVASLEQVFRKLISKRNEICVSNDLAGLYEIKRQFPEQKDQIAFNSEKPFLSLMSLGIFNKKHSEYKSMVAKFDAGHKKILKNGKWLSIVKKYYENREIPPTVLKLLNEERSKKLY